METRELFGGRDAVGQALTHGAIIPRYFHTGRHTTGGIGRENGRNRAACGRGGIQRPLGAAFHWLTATLIPVIPLLLQDVSRMPHVLAYFERHMQTLKN